MSLDNKTFRRKVALEDLFVPCDDCPNEETCWNLGCEKEEVDEEEQEEKETLSGV